ncbi:helix-turn-helix domain-containing protein [Leptobacterium flavescens]|uniref:Helix-turn-helix domain-containing protein n=1 Tax=Leptobacterium flavescens TaxID=472055 RepID=A0A6P0UTP1_9FLAO|nr:helix-turn-helix domain-containing protein [Leptobacterium flavescens]NER15378.1 helix-turn-helix domain-containing protein [Leptobacterium flavescens]
MSVTHYNDINDFLRDIRLPQLKHADFYIGKFKETDHSENMPEVSYVHNYFEISFAMGYDAQVSINDRTANALEYNLSFVSPGQVVSWSVSDIDRDPISFIILFRPEFLPFASNVFNLYRNFPYFNNNTLSSFALNRQQQELFVSYFKNIYHEYQRGAEDSLEMIRAYLSLLLFQAKREMAFNEGIYFTRNRSEEITYYFENLIQQTPHKHQPIKYYAGQLNISSIYLSECVKRATGKTAKQVIDEYLILEAKSLLQQSSASISEIAFDLGFEDNSNFVKYFKKHTLLTPRQFRNKP